MDDQICRSGYAALAVALLEERETTRLFAAWILLLSASMEMIMRTHKAYIFSFITGVLLFVGTHTEAGMLVFPIQSYDLCNNDGVRFMCPSCTELWGNKPQSGSESQLIFDPFVLKLRRQLRQLEEEKIELSYSKQRIAVTPQIALINQKMQDLRKKIKARQTGMAMS